MSTFGKIGSFLKSTVQGVVEIISAPFLSAQRAPTASSTFVIAASAAKERSLASYPRGAETAASAVAVASEPTNSPAGRIVSSEPYGPEFPTSAVTRRYRALKAEGLTPKQASEFSHSAKKYAQYRILSATRPYDGADTYWDTLKDFDQKAALHLQQMKQAAVLKQDILIFKMEIERARDLLIQKFIDGKDALAEDNFALIQKVAEAINARYF